MKDDWTRTEADDYQNNLQQRTEELYSIPDAAMDNDGLIDCAAFIMRDMLVYPRMISPVFISPGRNMLAVQDTQSTEETMIALVQQNPDIDEPGPEDFLPIGIEIAVGRLLSLSDGNNSALVQGRRRVEIVEFLADEPYYKVRARPIIEPLDVDREIDALMRTTRDLFEKCVQLDRSLPDEAHLFSINIPEPGWLADMIATAISLPFKERQTLLLLPDPRERLKRLNWLLAQELDVLQLEDEIQSKVQNEVDRSQREFYLREQMKAIQTELGEGDIWMRDIAELKERLEKNSPPRRSIESGA